MEKINRREQRGLLRYLLVLPLLAVLLLWGWGRYEQRAEQLYLEQRKDEVLHQLIEIMERLESSLNRRLFVALSIESYVYSRGGISAEEFQPFAENLWRYSGKGLRSLQVSVGTTVRHVYPLEGNEAVLGLDLLSITGQAEALRRTIEGRRMIVAGPYDLVQGGRAIIARKPIYLNQSAGGGYWGLATVIVDWEALLDESGIRDVAPELAITLRGRDGTGADGAFFYGDAAHYADAITLPITLPTGEWVLGGRPTSGWPNGSSTMAVERGVFTLLSLLLMAVALFAMRYPALLESRVRAATRELEANRALLELRVGERTAALQESEARMRQLFDSLPFPVIVTAMAGGNYLYANDRASELFDEDKTPTGQVASDYYKNPADRGRLLEALQRDGALSNFEVEFRTKSGKSFWSLMSAVQIEYDGCAAILASHTDISERKAIEQAHIASEKNLRTIFDSVPTPMAITRKSDGRLVRINRAGMTLSGLEMSQMAGFKADDFYCDAQERDRVMRLLELDGSVTDLEICMQSLKGDRYTFLMSATFIEYDNEPCLLSSYAEITERKKMEQALRQANREAQQAIRAKNEFLATMSHEIRTPLNGALSMVNLLGQTELNAQQREYLKAINFSGESLLQILSDVLDLSKLEAGKLELEQGDFNLAKMIGEMVGLMQVQRVHHEVRLEVTIDPRIPAWLRGDATRLRQVLFNLLGNALKFTERGEVTLRAEFLYERSGRVGIEYSVRDTGIGIADEVQPQLFGDFIQADSSVARRFGGSGLGLAICRRMVRLMGGEIGVESELGVGSRFWFRLELQRGELPLSRVDELPATRPLKALRVLLVEDDAINRIAGGELLRKEGCEVTSAADGYEALERFADGHFDAVLMDVRMPGMDGLMTTRKLRAIAPYGAMVPVIALTADVTQENIERCRSVGMQDVLSKPIRMERLREVLAGLQPLPRG